MEELTINDVHDVDAEKHTKFLERCGVMRTLLVVQTNQTIYVTGTPLAFMPLVNLPRTKVFGYKKLQISSPDFTYLHSSQLENL